MSPAAAPEAGGRIAAHLVGFARLLRGAGIPVGGSEIAVAAAAAAAVGIARRDDFRDALAATFVKRPEQRAPFAAAFELFWRGVAAARPEAAPETTAPGGAETAPSVLALMGTAEAAAASDRPAAEAALAWSPDEALRAKDFERMDEAELALARRIAATLAMVAPPRPTRRFRSDRGGRLLDARRSFRAALRSGGVPLELKRRTRILEPTPLVALCDVSGSMSRYERVLLPFLHGLCRTRRRVEVFLFGTRLSRVTPALRRRDAARAMAEIAALAEDRGGGTRIGAAIAEFNRRWARRVAGRGAELLLITDGLDRDAGAGLAREMARLRRGCRRLVWLNPLLRFPGYEPRALGAQAIRPYADELRPAHNLDSLAALAATLRGGPHAAGKPPRFGQSGPA